MINMKHRRWVGVGLLCACLLALPDVPALAQSSAVHVQPLAIPAPQTVRLFTEQSPTHPLLPTTTQTTNGWQGTYTVDGFTITVTSYSGAWASHLMTGEPISYLITVQDGSTPVAFYWTNATTASYTTIPVVGGQAYNSTQHVLRVTIAALKTGVGGQITIPFTIWTNPATNPQKHHVLVQIPLPPVEGVTITNPNLYVANAEWSDTALGIPRLWTEQRHTPIVAIYTNGQLPDTTWLQAQQQWLHEPMPTVNTILLAGATTSMQDSQTLLESNLDLQAVANADPYATIDVVAVPSTRGIIPFLQWLVQNPHITVATISYDMWGYTSAQMQTIQALVNQVLANGTTIMLASGDTGPSVLQGANADQLDQLHGIVKVGGLDATPYQSQWSAKGWAGAYLHYAPSSMQSISYASTGAPNQVSMVPDIAGEAGGWGYPVWLSQGPWVTVVLGTSIAAPLNAGWYAAAWATENTTQALTPSQIRQLPASDFLQAGWGSNGPYVVTPGWNPVTGFGQLNWAQWAQPYVPPTYTRTEGAISVHGWPIAYQNGWPENTVAPGWHGLLIVTPPSKQPLTQWWVETNGHWQMVQNYSATPQYALPALPAGTTRIVIAALSASQVAHHQWSDATFWHGTLNVESAVTATVTNSNQLTATSQNITDPVYQAWGDSPAGWIPLGAYTPTPHWILPTGVTRVVVYSKPAGASAPAGSVWTTQSVS